MRHLFDHFQLSTSAERETRVLGAPAEGREQLNHERRFRDEGEYDRMDDEVNTVITAHTHGDTNGGGPFSTHGHRLAIMAAGAVFGTHDSV